MRRHQHEKIRSGRHKNGRLLPPTSRAYTTGPSSPPSLPHVSSSLSGPLQGLEEPTLRYTYTGLEAWR